MGAVFAAWVAVAGCGERGPLTVVEVPPVPQSAEAEQAPPPFQESPVGVSETAEPDFSAYALLESSALISDSIAAARRAEESEYDRRLRQLDFEAVQNAPQFNYYESPEPALFDELNQTEIPDNFDIAKNREAAFAGYQVGFAVVLNKHVIPVDQLFYEPPRHKTFKRTMERAGAYRGMIERILEEEGVPREMLHLAQAESGFRSKAISHARATGMWQFMSFRGKQYGLRRNRYMDERYDAELATRAAARHLKDLYIEFGDWYLAMAAYNGGPNRVRRGIRASGSRDYWELSRRRFLRRETRNYVPIILAMTYVAKNEWLYESTEFDWAPPLRYDTVEVDLGNPRRPYRRNHGIESRGDPRTQSGLAAVGDAPDALQTTAAARRRGLV